MRYTHLKNADVDVSQIAVGTWALGGSGFGAVDRAESIKAIRRMIENGVNLIDTAPCYGNGAAEMIVGEAIQGLDREKLLISTKFGLVPDIRTGGYRKIATYENAMHEVMSSLMNLKTKYIDFYFVHWPDVNTPIEETMTALNELKEKGVIRHIGVSNFSEEQILEAEKYAKIDVQQPKYCMVDRPFENLIKWGYEKGIDSLTYGSMGAGILSGKYRTVPDWDPKDIRLNFYDYFREPKFSKIQELLKTLDVIAEAHGKPVTQVALNWSTQKDWIGTALVGVRSEAHANENCATFDWELTDEEMAMIDKKLEEVGL